MGARRVQGNFNLASYVVATSQAVEPYDLVGYAAATVTRAADQTWASAISTPSAPTVAASAASRGTALTNAATGVKVAIQLPWGEGTLSSAGSATPTAAYGLKVTLAACPSPGLGWNVYVEDSAGSGTYLFQQFVPASTAPTIIYVDSYGAGAAPGTLNASGSAVAQGAKEVTQYNFCKTFLGVSNQRMATTGFFGAPTRPFGNSVDNQIMICRGGVFEFDTASASYAEGAYVGPAKASGNALLSQTVAAVAHPTLAIGKVFKLTSSSTKVMVEIMSRFTTPAPTVANPW